MGSRPKRTRVFPLTSGHVAAGPGGLSDPIDADANVTEARETPCETLGMLLRRLRMVAGFTQEELAERAGISVYSISNIERDVPHTPRPETLRFLTQALQLSRHETAQVVAYASSLRKVHRMRNTHTTAETAPSTTATPRSTTLSQAIMYATVGWLALCVERTATAVDIQPVAEGLYEVSVHFDAERTEGIILRVRLEVAPGLVMRTVVEPVRP